MKTDTISSHKIPMRCEWGSTWEVSTLSPLPIFSHKLPVARSDPSSARLFGLTIPENPKPPQRKKRQRINREIYVQEYVDDEPTGGGSEDDDTENLRRRDDYDTRDPGSPGDFADHQLLPDRVFSFLDNSEIQKVRVNRLASLLFVVKDSEILEPM